MTAQTLAVLAVVLNDPRRPWYGREIAREAGLKSGTLYPALARLEEAGWLTSSWENVDPRVAGRPRRRLYELTGEGQALATVALDEHLSRLHARRAGRRTPHIRPKALPA